MNENGGKKNLHEYEIDWVWTDIFHSEDDK